MVAEGKTSRFARAHVVRLVSEIFASAGEVRCRFAAIGENYLTQDCIPDLRDAD